MHTVILWPYCNAFCICNKVDSNYCPKWGIATLAHIPTRNCYFSFWMFIDNIFKAIYEFPLSFIVPRTTFSCKGPSFKTKRQFWIQKKSAFPYICEKWSSTKRGLRDQYFCQTDICWSYTGWFFFNWTSPEFANCWPVNNWFKKTLESQTGPSVIEKRLSVWRSENDSNIKKI